MHCNDFTFFGWVLFFLSELIGVSKKTNLHSITQILIAIFKVIYGYCHRNKASTKSLDDLARSITRSDKSNRKDSGAP